MVDVHTHFMLPEHWGPEYETNWQPTYGHPWPTVDAARFDADMAAAGVTAAIVFGITALRAGVRTPSRIVAEFCARTKTPTVGFMALDPLAPDAVDELEEGVELGLRGVKLYPVLAHFLPDDPPVARFLELAARHRLVLLWHMGATPSPPGRLSASHPLLVDEVAIRHPDLPQVIAHMAHPWQREAVVVARKNANVFCDVSGLWARPLDGYMALVRAQEWGVVDKLLFGSDWPVWTPRAGVDGLRALAALEAGTFPRVRQETIEAILARDALAALGVDGAAR